MVPPRVACVQAGLHPVNSTRVERIPYVQNRIRELREMDIVDVTLTRRVLREELYKLVFCRVPDLFTVDANGRRYLLPMEEWTDDQRAAVSEIWTDKDGIDRVKTHSKLSAIDLLMKLDGLSEPERVDVNHSGSTELNVNDARERISGRIQTLAGRAASLPKPDRT
jgi:hypothetical protein